MKPFYGVRTYRSISSLYGGERKIVHLCALACAEEIELKTKYMCLSHARFGCSTLFGEAGRFGFERCTFVSHLSCLHPYPRTQHRQRSKKRCNNLQSLFVMLLYCPELQTVLLHKCLHLAIKMNYAPLVIFRVLPPYTSPQREMGREGIDIIFQHTHIHTLTHKCSRQTLSTFISCALPRCRV